VIVWLASYPRSGNTLLRTVLKQSMGLDSFSDEDIQPALGLTREAERQFGHVPLPAPWDAFYREASASPAVTLVKTHLPPRDAQPAIYVVRDGRRAIVSYRSYHKEFFPDHEADLASLVLGDDHYGGWSDHYERWFKAAGPRMVVRYEELVDADAGLLERLARFISHAGPVAPWRNPFDELHRENPKFFRAGGAKWEGAPGWSELVDGAFFLLHGALMNELGYATPGEIAQATSRLSPDQAAFLHAARSLARQKIMYEQASRERLAVIEGLDAQVKSLSRVCAERLEAIEALDAEVRRRAAQAGP